MIRVAHRPERAFGERFARSTAIAFAGLALYVTFGSIVPGRPYAFYIALGCLPLYHGWRTRAARREQRRGEAMEDERDAAIRANGDHWFRIAASSWYGLLALALSLETVRGAFRGNAYAVPGLVLLGIVVANIAAHVAAIRAYARDRSEAAR